MLFERVIRGLESGAVVALLAVVLPGRRSELALVFILVAIDAERKLDFELCVFARRSMAGSALDRSMREDEWEAGLRVIRNGKCGWAPSQDSVATLAAAAIGTLQKLASMRIGLVAVGTCLVGYRRLEVSAGVASHARHIDVLSKQRKLRLRMVECRGEAGFLPRRGVVAGIAPLFEFAFVRILMAIGAACERQPCIAWLPVRAGGMTTLAQNIPVRTCKWIAGLGVIEVLPVNARCLPIEG